MELEKELHQIFKESYLEYFAKFVAEDEEYHLFCEKIKFVEKKVQESPTKANKKILDKVKFQLVEYVYISLFKQGFLEGIKYNQLEENERLT